MKYKKAPTEFRNYNAQYLTALLFVILIILYLLGILSMNLLRGLESGLSGDASIFMAVGRGILNGLTPYADLFETKPPGVFLLYAATLYWFEGVDLLRMIMVAVGVSIPAFFLWQAWRMGSKNSWDRLVLIVAGLSFGIIISLHEIHFWDGYQLLASFLCMAYAGSFVSIAHRWIRIIVGIITLLLVALLREPMVFVHSAITILMIPRLREIVGFSIATTLPAAVLWIIFMTVTGYLGPYLEIYLPNIMGTRGDGIGHVLMTSFTIWNAFAGLRGFASLFSIGFMLVLVSLLWQQRHEKIGMPLWLRLLAALCVTTIAVRIGEKNSGMNTNNAVPLYAALVMMWLQTATFFDFEKLRPRWHMTAAMCSIILAAILIPVMPVSAFPSPLEEHIGYQWQIREAEQLDRIMDRCNEERYFYLGTSQAVISLTHHSPLGPLFFEAKLLLMDEALTKTILPNVRKANLVLIDTDHELPFFPGFQNVSDELNSQFTFTPWECAGEEFLNPQGYRLLYRKKVSSTITKTTSKDE